MVGGHGWCQALQVVLCNETEHVDRVLRAAVGRGIGQFEVSEVVDGSAQTHGCGQDVDTLVDAVVAGSLSAEQLALGAVEQFDMDWRAARVVSCVRARVDGDGPEGDAHLRQQGRTGAGGSCGKIEDLDDGCALCSFVDIISACNVVGSDTCLAVSRACQRDERLALRDKVFDLDDVTDGIDIGVTGAEVFVHQDAVGGANSKSSLFGYLRVWSYADGEDDHICCKLCPAGECDYQCTVHVLRK